MFFWSQIQLTDYNNFYDYHREPLPPPRAKINKNKKDLKDYKKQSREQQMATNNQKNQTV